jgi:hypothetical protein
MKITRAKLKETLRTVVQEESEYQSFFKNALEKAGKSIPSMSDEEKKAFFDKIDAAWDGRGEKNEALVGGQKELDVDGDGDIQSDDLADLRAGKKADESVNEIQYKDAVEKFNKELIKHPMIKKAAQHYKKTPADIVKVLQQRISTKGDRAGETKEISIDFKDTDSGIVVKHKMKFTESVNEAFKHIIHVDTPTQVVSKPIAAQIMALAKKGVRSNEIGLEMGFTGNAKLATDAFQKVKNQIYFALDKRN